MHTTRLDRGVLMSIIFKKSALGDLLVKHAMRRQVVSLHSDSTIQTGLRNLIKYKVNALLVTNHDELPVGVVSKTDVMAAYYACLSLQTPLEQIMMSPPRLCRPDDSLVDALNSMRCHMVYRVYVSEGIGEKVVGVLAYGDILGLLYHYCHTCERGMLNRRKRRKTGDLVPRFRVKDVMTRSVMSISHNDALSHAMESLSVYGFGAILVNNSGEMPIGVLSKSDLVLAYKRGISPDVMVKMILSSRPVLSCSEDDYLEDAIRKMIFSEVRRLFVHEGHPQNVVGVFSLSDAAKLRSGSCLACESARMKVEAPR